MSVDGIFRCTIFDCELTTGGGRYVADSACTTVGDLIEAPVHVNNKLSKDRLTYDRLAVTTKPENGVTGKATNLYGRKRNHITCLSSHGIKGITTPDNILNITLSPKEKPSDDEAPVGKL